MTPLSVIGFVLAGVLAANLGAGLALTERPLWQRLLAPPALLSAWLALALWLDPAWPTAQLPGHTVAVAAALFIVFGFPTFVATRWWR